MTGDGKHTAELRVARTQSIRPSKIGIFESCALRYVLETEKLPIKPLKSSYLALLGNAVHKVIENIAREDVHVSVDINVQIRSELERQLDFDIDSISRWIFKNFGIHALISHSRMIELSRFARSQANSAVSKRQVGRASEGGWGIVGYERWLASEKYDLAGKADAIFKVGDKYTITDYKLGFRRDFEGNPNVGYLLQLGAYALIVESLSEEKAKIEVELCSPNDKFTAQFSEKLREQVLGLIEKINQTTPKNISMSAVGLATFGAGCSACSYRCHCDVYRLNLRNSPLEELDQSAPIDLAGEVTAIDHYGELMSVRVRAVLGGRKVLIKGIPSSLFGALLKVGCHYEFYALRSSELSGRGRLVSNYFVIDEAAPRNSSTSFFLREMQN